MASHVRADPLAAWGLAEGLLVAKPNSGGASPPSSSTTGSCTHSQFWLYDGKSVCVLTHDNQLLQIYLQ